MSLVCRSFDVPVEIDAADEAAYLSRAGASSELSIADFDLDQARRTYAAARKRARLAQQAFDAADATFRATASGRRFTVTSNEWLDRRMAARRASLLTSDS